MGVSKESQNENNFPLLGILQVFSSKVFLLFFLLHASDSRSSIRFSSPVHFADDAVFFSSKIPEVSLTKLKKTLVCRENFPFDLTLIKYAFSEFATPSCKWGKITSAV